MNQPKVSVIIPIFNAAPYIIETLESIFEQSYKNIELVLIDNGSTDSTNTILKRYERLANIITIQKCNVGKARNIGFSYATGEFYALFDADDLMHKDKVALQVDFLMNNPSISFVFTDYINFHNTIDMCATVSHITTCVNFQSLLPGKTGGLKDNTYIINKDNAYETLIFENFIGTPSIIFRKELVKKIGLFDETLVISEDRDYTYRVTQHYDLGFINQVLFFRRLHANNITKDSVVYLRSTLEVAKRQLGTCSNRHLRRKIKHRLGDLFTIMGNQALTNKHHKIAFQYFFKSLCCKPYSTAWLKGFIKSVLYKLHFFKPV